MSPGYGDYLGLADLLDLQRPRSSPVVHDELLFITVHQAHELWFRQLLIELGDARDHLLAGNAHVPRRRLERCHAIERLLLQQFDVLDTMSAPDFASFRGALGTASGVQSVQFREIALLSGAKETTGLDCAGFSETERERLRRRFAEPSLWDGFLVVLGKAGFEVSTVAERAEAYRCLVRERHDHDALWQLAEALVAHDQAWALWQARHLLTVRRQIGTKRGTATDGGAAYLASHQDARFYPELWELRAGL